MEGSPEDDKPPKATKVTPPKPAAKSTSKAKSTKAKAPTGGNDAKPKSTKPAGRPRILENQLYDFFVTVGTMVSMFNAEDGLVIGANAEPLAKAWADLAAEDKRVKAAIDKMMQGSAWGGVIFATGSVAMGIANNHGLLDNLYGMRGGDEPEDEGPPPPPPGMTV